MKDRLAVIYGLIQKQKDVPADDDWLSRQEQEQLAALKFPKRRADWRLGRWTAKQLICAYLERQNQRIHPRRISIIAAPDGAPRVFISQKPAQLVLSISHSEGTAFCTLAEAPVRLGCDIERIAHRSPAFVRDYFTPEEIRLVQKISQPNDDLFITLIWSAKESALKLLRQGLRLDTRSVTVDFLAKGTGTSWHPLQVSHTASGQRFHGYYRSVDGFINTVVTDVPAVRIAEVPNP